ncbi:MAG: DUF2029 domain-containing protein [Candidatus Hydrogenedentes bacterium]|nr:DUF2029 domain-containing protein [Candidatus Hydrogenedentota bacterium]
MDKATFVYPPTIAVISLPMSLLPWKIAAWTFRFTSFLATAGICLLAARLGSESTEKSPLLGPLGWYAGACALLGSAHQAIFQGQLSLIVVFGCLAAWYGHQRRILWLFLLGFLLASIKPQISLIPLLYILFSGNVRWFTYGVMLCASVSLFMLIAVPTPDLFAAYDGSMENHLKYQYFNSWSWYCGVPALFGATPWGKYFMLLGIALGGAGTAWVARANAKLNDTLSNRLRHQQLVWIIAMAAMPVHIYDLTGQYFIVITLWAMPGWTRRATVFACMLVGDKSYQIAPRLSKIGLPPELSDWARVHGASVMATMLLIAFILWYWRDFGPRKTLNPKREPGHS